MNLLDAVNSPLSGTCERWLSLLKEAKKIKHELFGQYADEAAKFYDSDHNHMWSQEYATAKQGGYLATDSFGANGLPTFRVTVNPMADAVRLFGPALYHKNPNIIVQAKHPPRMDPADLGMNEQDPAQAEAIQAAMSEQEFSRTREDATGKLCQHYLNWLQLETDKKIQSRRAINDAIVKGLGLLWTEIYTPPNSSIKYPRSTYISCDDLLKDPDARYQEDVQWIARKCIHPVNLVEEKYGYEPGSLRGTMQSLHSQQNKKSKRELTNGKRDSKSFDLIEYWEIYSKNGAGQFLKSVPKEKWEADFDVSIFGKYCYLAVCEELPFPLNVPPSLTQAYEEMPSEESASALVQATQWPIPFWEDEGCNNGWPCAELGFYESTDHIWPIPLIKPAIGEIRFVNWCMSFLADKSAASCKTYLAMVKSAAEEMRQQLAGQNGPFTVLELSAITGKNINEIISFLKAPEFDKAIFEVVAQVMQEIDKRTGLTELVYGLSARQMRSAEEAKIKNENTTIRPDEMASKTEDFLSDCAMKEMEAAVWALDENDFAHVLGSTGTQVFVNNVFGDENFYEHLVRNFSFRVEAGSARKPNKANKIDQLNQLGQMFLPVASQMALGGQIDPFNTFMRDMAEALDLVPDGYQLSAPPQPPGQDPEAQMQLEQQKLDMDMQAKQADMQLKQQGLEMDLQKKQAEIEAIQQKLQMELQGKQMEMQLDAAKFQQDSQIQQAQFAQDTQVKAREMQQQSLQAAHKASLDQQGMKIKEQQAKAAAKNKPKAK